MKGMKRFWPLLGALFLMMTSVLQGCDSNNTQAVDDKVTVRLLDYFTSEPGDSAMKNLIKSFEKKHPNINIKENSVDRNTLAMKIIQQGSTDSLPGILIIDNPSLKQIASSGILTPLNQLGDIDKSKYYNSSLSTVTYNNNLYGLPIGNNTLALFYNKQILKHANIDPPKTWEQLGTAAKALTQGSTYGLAFAAPNSEEATWQFLPFLWSNGGNMRNVDSAKSIQTLTFWTDLVRSGYVSQSVVNWTQTNVRKQFAHGNAAMMINGLWELPVLDEVSGLDYGVVPIPVPKSGMMPKVPLGGEVITIPKTTQEIEKAAWTFVNWMQDAQRLDKINEKFNYISAYKPATKKLLDKHPDWRPFYKGFINGQARTQYLGANYPVASQAVWTAIQVSLTGKQTPKKALKEAQKKISQTIEK